MDAFPPAAITAIRHFIDSMDEEDRELFLDVLDEHEDDVPLSIPLAWFRSMHIRPCAAEVGGREVGENTAREVAVAF